MERPRNGMEKQTMIEIKKHTKKYIGKMAGTD
jgi:hypothetical protein